MAVMVGYIEVDKLVPERLPRLLKILHDYGLFICDDFTFYSPKLNELMKLLEDTRARIETLSRRK